MNERIQKLAKQAFEVGLDTDPILYYEVEKFAELIVKECAQIAKEVDGDEGDDYQSGRKFAGIDVLKHFGVEE